MRQHQTSLCHPHDYKPSILISTFSFFNIFLLSFFVYFLVIGTLLRMGKEQSHKPYGWKDMSNRYPPSLKKCMRYTPILFNPVAPFLLCWGYRGAEVFPQPLPFGSSPSLPSFLSHCHPTWRKKVVYFLREYMEIIEYID